MDKNYREIEFGAGQRIESGAFLIQIIMKKDTIYYLKKYHKPLITSKKENTKAVIDWIDN
jgi:hypothetical protein